LSPYAIAKDGSFNTVQLYREAYGLRCVTGILINHESPYRSGAFVTRKIVEGALRCKREPGYRLQLGNLDMARDWGWAEEYVDAMQILVRADQLADKVICTGRMETLEYFVDLVFTQLGLNWHDCVELKESLRWPSEIPRSVSNPEPMAQRHGWRAERDVDAVVDALLGYWRVPNT
jgi:GDPmannose 4,6-dehydratase